jgi:hypothetical protein
MATITTMSKIVRVPLEKEISRALVVFDVHSEDVERRAWGACLNYASTKKYDYVVNGGDWVSFSAISHHDKHKLRKMEGRRLLKNFSALENSAKELKEAAIGSSTEAYWIQGNHEEWLDRYLDEHPELDGLEDFDLLGRVRKIIPGINWIPFWSKGTVLQIGKAKFIHGPRRGRGCGKVLRSYGGNVFFGHEHHDHYLSDSRLEDNEMRGVQCCGTFQSPSVDFMAGAPNTWVHAFLEILFFKNGTFTYYMPRIFNGRFVSQEGKVFQG